MKIYSYLSTMILFSILIWNTSLVAQDDLYFDPATDENFEAPTEYGDNESGDEYVDEAFNDEDYYYDDDFYYSRRIRRYNRPNNSSFGYYNPWFTNNSYIDPFYYNNGPSVYVSFGNNYGYNPYSPYGNPYGYNPYNNYYGGYNNPYAYNPYYNSYIDPCYNPYYNSYYSSYGYYGGNPYNGNNDSYNPNADYPTANNSNYGPRGGTGGTVDAFGNGKLSGVKQGRDNVVEEEQELQYFEAGGRTTVKGNTARDPIQFDANEGNTRTGRATETETETGSTRSNSGKTEIRSDEPARSTKPSRDTREPRSTTPPRSSTPRSTPKSSTPRSTPRSSSSSSGSSSKNDRSSSGKSSSRSGGKSPR